MANIPDDIMKKIGDIAISTNDVKNLMSEYDKAVKTGKVNDFMAKLDGNSPITTTSVSNIGSSSGISGQSQNPTQDPNLNADGTPKAPGFWSLDTAQKGLMALPKAFLQGADTAAQGLGGLATNALNTVVVGGANIISDAVGHPLNLKPAKNVYSQSALDVIDTNLAKVGVDPKWKLGAGKTAGIVGVNDNTAYGVKDAIQSTGDVIGGSIQALTTRAAPTAIGAGGTVLGGVSNTETGGKLIKKAGDLVSPYIESLSGDKKGSPAYNRASQNIENIVNILGAGSLKKVGDSFLNQPTYLQSVKAIDKGVGKAGKALVESPVRGLANVAPELATKLPGKTLGGIVTDSINKQMSKLDEKGVEQLASHLTPKVSNEFIKNTVIPVLKEAIPNIDAKNVTKEAISSRIGTLAEDFYNNGNKLLQSFVKDKAPIGQSLDNSQINSFKVLIREVAKPLGVGSKEGVAKSNMSIVNELSTYMKKLNDKTITVPELNNIRTLFNKKGPDLVNEFGKSDAEMSSKKILASHKMEADKIVNDNAPSDFKNLYTKFSEYTNTKRQIDETRTSGGGKSITQSETVVGKTPKITIPLKLANVTLGDKPIGLSDVLSRAQSNNQAASYLQGLLKKPTK